MCIGRSAAVFYQKTNIGEGEGNWGGEYMSLDGGMLALESLFGLGIHSCV